jgi:hypothetical protein
VGLVFDSRMVWNVQSKKVKILYAKSNITLGNSQVLRSKLSVGIRGNHPPRLNKTKER